MEQRGIRGKVEESPDLALLHPGYADCGTAVRPIYGERAVNVRGLIIKR
jgi:hypothetical protein